MKKLSVNFKNIYLSQLFANCGDIIYVVSLLSYVYNITGSAQKSAIIPILITIALFTTGFLSPYLYSKFYKKSILLFNQSAKTIIMFLLLLVIFKDYQLIYVYILVFLNSFFDGFTNPIKNILIPFTEDEEVITLANAKMSVMNNIVQIGSWSLGGVLLASIGNLNIIILTISFYILSIIFILKLTIEKDVLDDNSEEGVFDNFNKMISYNMKNNNSIFLNLNTFFEGFAHSVWVAAILLVFIKESLHAGEEWFGIINALFFLGLLVGGILINRNHIYYENKDRNIVLYFPIILATLVFVFGINKYVLIAAIISFLYGLADELRTTLIHSKIQINLDDDGLLYTYTLNHMIYSFVFCISTYIMATIVDYTNSQIAFFVAFIFYILIFLISKKFIYLFQKKS